MSQPYEEEIGVVLNNLDDILGRHGLYYLDVGEGRKELAKQRGLSTPEAKAKISALIRDVVVAELEAAHRAGGSLDADNATDEFIDERVEALKDSIGSVHE